jgi:HEAT repeat protein
MRRRTGFWLLMVMVLNCAAARAVDSAAIDKAFAALKTYDWGTDRNLLSPIDEAAIATRGNPAARKELEVRLAAILKTDASRAAKDFVCRKLMLIGTAESVPALSGLLPDKDLSHMARYALERIAAPEAAQALRDALPKLNGATKVGVIVSLGARRDAASVPALTALLGDADKTVARAAAFSLGTIGSVDAGRSLSAAVKTASEGVKDAVAEASLICAERLLADGRKPEALAIYGLLRRKNQPKTIRLAAMRGLLTAAAATGDERLETITGLLTDGDRDVVALGLQHVRQRGDSAATQRFAALLPKLPLDRQPGLLGALSDRGDKTARPAVLAMLKSPDVQVRAAAIRAVGSLGQGADVAMLAQALAAATDVEKTAAKTSLTGLQGSDVNAAIVAEVKRAEPGLRAELLRVLLARRALDTIPAMLEAALDDDARVRQTALDSLGRLAGPEHVAAMTKAVLKAPAGRQREAAEKAVMFVCSRIAEPDKRADPVLAVFAEQGSEAKTILLPLIGRLGGPSSLKQIETALADSDSRFRSAGFRALCNWPDASVAPKLTELAQSGADASQRESALLALMRVAALPDKRPDAERLDLLKKAMGLAANDQQRNYAIRRAKAIRTIDSLRFVVPYLDKPEYAQEACATVVELAHHRKLREPNKAEFDRVLDAVIGLSKNPDLIDRAKRYRKGQT